MRFIEFLVEAAAAKQSPSNYESFVKRINDANTLEDLKKLEKSLDRVYNTGVISVSEFKRLDSKMLDKFAELHTKD